MVEPTLPASDVGALYEGDEGRPPIALDPAQARARAEELRGSIAPDLYTPDVYVPWNDIEAMVLRLERATRDLQELVDSQAWAASTLADVLLSPGTFEVIRLLLVAPSAVGFADGREIPVEVPADADRRRELAQLLIEIGLPRLLPPSSSVRDLLRLGAVALDSRRRAVRRRGSIADEVRDLVKEALAAVKADIGLELEDLPSSRWPPHTRGRVEQLIAFEGQPVAAISSFFAAQTGGRQQRTLSTTYPVLQRDLDTIPASLILIVDGRGVKEAPSYVLEGLVRSVGSCMSRVEASDGMLASALIAAVERRGARPGRRVAVDTLIGTGMQQSDSVSADSLPVPRRDAVLALAEYKANHPELALDLDPSGRLSWARSESVAAAHRLRGAFDPERAVGLLLEILGLRPLPIEELPATLSASIGCGSVDPVLPEQMVIAATRQAADRPLIQLIARINRQKTVGSLAALIVPDVQAGDAVEAGLQRQMATSVILLDIARLAALAGHISPRSAFVREVLRQADLTKTNPFNPTGATPPQMFFGREEEEASLLATLDSNSAALIGGRRIGKTSLLQHSVSAMIDAGWNTFYADCQAVGSWSDFVRHVGPRWQVDVPEQFASRHLSDLVTDLASRADAKTIIVLDEVDNLLAWDDVDEPGRIRESFFRTCRALSQEGRAQFVFSGERRISEKLWDPSSPHWNFCRPIPVRQLSVRASGNLITVPLEALGVTLQPAADAAAVAWRYTSGHPQILQELGMRVVNQLNGRPPDKRSMVGPRDLEAVAASDGFARHYLETYWGQATTLEKLLSVLVGERGSVWSMEKLRVELDQLGVSHDGDSVAAAIRMLSLYGVVDDAGGSVVLRAEYLSEAFNSVGGAQRLIQDLTASFTGVHGRDSDGS